MIVIRAAGGPAPAQAQLGGYASRHPRIPPEPLMSQDPRKPKRAGERACPVTAAPGGRLMARADQRPGDGPVKPRKNPLNIKKWRVKEREGNHAMSGDGPKAPRASPDPGGRDDWRTTFRPDIPSSARIYDYFLGGRDHYPADRDAAEQIAAYLPNIREAARINRAFVRRAVRFLVNEAGIRQLIDIGTGLPTMGNVHEVATAAHPATRVAALDTSPTRSWPRSRP